jgi:Holliday junction resolvase
MTPEGKVKKRVADILKKRGVCYFSPMTYGYGASGMPDIVGCYKGRFIAVECKAGKNKLTPLQERTIENIRAAKGLVLVVNEDNVDDVTYVLNVLDGSHDG